MQLRRWQENKSKILQDDVEVEIRKSSKSREVGYWANQKRSNNQKKKKKKKKKARRKFDISNWNTKRKQNWIEVAEKETGQKEGD